LAHVQPQTQCTITPAAREEKSKMKQREKGNLEFHIKTQAGIKETSSKYRLAPTGLLESRVRLFHIS